MLKLSISQFKAKWKVLLGVFLTLLVSTILLATFSLLLINSVYAIILGKDSHLQVPEAPVSIFGTMVGITFFISLFALYSVIMLSVRLRYRQFLRLRMIGATYGNLQRMILLENLLMGIVCVIIGLIVALFMSSKIILYLQSVHALEGAFRLYKKFAYQWIYIIATMAFILLISVFAVMPLRKIEVSTTRNPFYTMRKSTAVFRIIFGLIWIGGALALSTIPDILYGGLGTGMTILAVFCYVIGFALLGSWLIKGCLFLLRLVVCWSLLARNVLLSIRANIYQMFLPIALLVSLGCFIGYAVNIPMMSQEMTGQMVKNFCLPIKSSLVASEKGRSFQASERQYGVQDNNFIAQIKGTASIQDDGVKQKSFSVWAIDGEKILFNGNWHLNNWKDFFNAQPNVILAKDQNFVVQNNQIKLHFFKEKNNYDILCNVVGYSDVPSTQINLPAIFINESYFVTSTNLMPVDVNEIDSVNVIKPLDSDFVTADVTAQFANNDSVVRGVMALLITIIAIFNTIVGVNAIIQYCLNKRAEYYKLWLIGYQNGHIFLSGLFEGFLISCLGFIFGAIPVLYMDWRFGLANGLNQLYADGKQFWLIYLVIFIITWVVFMAAHCYACAKHKHLKAAK